jgi:hypothetical protein
MLLFTSWRARWRGIDWPCCVVPRELELELIEPQMAQKLMLPRDRHGDGTSKYHIYFFTFLYLSSFLASTAVIRTRHICELVCGLQSEVKSRVTLRGNTKAARSVNHRGLPGGSGLWVCI